MFYISYQYVKLRNEGRIGEGGGEKREGGGGEFSHQREIAMEVRIRTV